MQWWLAALAVASHHNIVEHIHAQMADHHQRRQDGEQQLRQRLQQRCELLLLTLLYLLQSLHILLCQRHGFIKVLCQEILRERLDERTVHCQEEGPYP